MRSERVRARRAGKVQSKSAAVGVRPVRRISRKREAARSRWRGRPWERAVIAVRMSAAMRGWPSWTRRRARWSSQSSGERSPIRCCRPDGTAAARGCGTPVVVVRPGQAAGPVQSS
ncbi:hypothetical protein A6A28_32600 [Streptomyces sp. CB03578]|nr:hypothetical protein A6A28_32600 [Streptomyces sp. CB03578]